MVPATTNFLTTPIHGDGQHGGDLGKNMIG
jgi:hypothetical protein